MGMGNIPLPFIPAQSLQQLGDQSLAYTGIWEEIRETYPPIRIVTLGGQTWK